VVLKKKEEKQLETREIMRLHVLLYNKLNAIQDQFDGDTVSYLIEKSEEETTTLRLKKKRQGQHNKKTTNL
jgi:hypothetical protein